MTLEVPSNPSHSEGRGLVGNTGGRWAVGLNVLGGPFQHW